MDDADQSTPHTSHARVYEQQNKNKRGQSSAQTNDDDARNIQPREHENAY